MKNLDKLKYAYDNYAGRVLSICMRYSPNRATAEDMMQDTFVQAYKSFDKFKERGDGSLYAWLCKIAVNTCLQQIRKKDLLKNSSDISYQQEQIAEDNIENSINAIPESTLIQYIEELPDGYRTVFNLYVFENYSHKEIAEMLGINERSSSSQLFRAKKLLAKKISEYGKRER